MSVTINLNQSQSVAGLQTVTWTAAAAGPITVQCESTIPLASALQIVINQNGSPVVTSGGSATNPTPTQQSLGAQANISCAASDVITVVLSSANAVDALPNAVKSVVSLFQTI
jgi:hypothetical protein